MSHLPLSRRQADLHAKYLSFTRESIIDLPSFFERYRKLGLLQIMLIMQAAHFGLSSGGGQSWEDAIEDVATDFGSRLGWGAHPSVSRQAFHKAIHKIDKTALADLENSVYQAIEYGPQSSPMSSLHGYRLVLGDGTQIRTDRSPELVEEFGCQTNGRSSTSHYPTALMVTLVEAGSHRVLANQLARCKAKEQAGKTKDPLPMDERAAFDCLRPHLKENDCILLDCGFASYGVFYEMCQAKQPFMVAIPKGLALTKKFRRRKQAQATIHFKIPATAKDKACRGKELHLKVFRIYGADGKSKYVATNILEKFTLSDYRRAYKARWGVEVFFRNAKKHMGMRKLRSRTLKGVKLEILAIMLYMQWMTTIQMLIAHAVNAPRSVLDTLITGYKKVKVSSAFKAAWATLGAVLTGPGSYWRTRSRNRFFTAIARLREYIGNRRFPRVSKDPIGVWMPKRPDRNKR